MKDVNAGEMSLLELAEASGVPARTIRLYIARGLVAGPLRAGRGAAYGPEHLATLRRIRDLQKEGLTLAQIRQALAGTKLPEEVPPPTAWWSYQVAPDLVVNVRGDAHPWRIRQIRSALAMLQEYFGTDHKEGKTHDDRR